MNVGNVNDWFVYLRDAKHLEDDRTSLLRIATAYETGLAFGSKALTDAASEAFVTRFNTTPQEDVTARVLGLLDVMSSHKQTAPLVILAREMFKRIYGFEGSEALQALAYTGIRFNGGELDESARLITSAWLDRCDEKRMAIPGQLLHMGALFRRVRAAGHCERIAFNRFRCVKGSTWAFLRCLIVYYDGSETRNGNGEETQEEDVLIRLRHPAPVSVCSRGEDRMSFQVRGAPTALEGPWCIELNFWDRNERFPEGENFSLPLESLTGLFGAWSDPRCLPEGRAWPSRRDEALDPVGFMAAVRERQEQCEAQ